ncbi:MAG: hypothetical protein DWQ37_20145 [Planctomycetota bacterium]|nr:MAG: hypothetical protein DWQ37_20145 [Planctomycetota bacterium]
MRELYLGCDLKSGRRVYLPKRVLARHLHLPGATGTGKTTALLTLLRQLLTDVREPECHFIVDFLGGLSFELLLWMASRYCPESVRRRLVYICPAREGVVLGFNPLHYQTSAEAYYRCARATELILRGWESQDIQAMPRLARWTFNSFHAVQQLGLTIGDSAHLLFPGSDLHRRLLECLPERLRYEWRELIGSHSAEVVRTLESTRNRLKPFFDSDILRLMFSSTENRADLGRMMRERRIVVLNLSPQNRLAPQLADTFAGLFFNELLTTARSLPLPDRVPTYCWLDEFQRMISGPDLEFAIPEVRQLGIRLVLAHQSFSQLARGEVDLTSLIWQAQTRLAFGNQGEDADLLARELASLTYDPMQIKDEIWSRRQLVTGHKIIELATSANAQAFADSWQSTFAQNWNRKTTYVDGRIGPTSMAEGQTQGTGSSGSATRTTTHGVHQSVLPEYEQFLELSSRTYVNFDEQRERWASEVRRLTTGYALLWTPDGSGLRHVLVDQMRPGPMAFELEVLLRRFPGLVERYEELIEENFAQRDFFVSPAVIEQETRERLARVLQPPQCLSPPAAPASDSPTHPFS